MKDHDIIKNYTIVGECWEWEGNIHKHSGYPMVWYSSRWMRAHRVVYSLLVKDIPDALCILHTCGNKICVNPKHLRVGTHKENMKDIVDQGKAGRISFTTQDEIRKNYATGKLSQTAIANKYKISQSSVSYIVNNTNSLGTNRCQES